MSGQPTRFYGLALGKERNFEVTSDGLIAESATGANVETKSLFYTNNTTATIISNLYNGVEGQVVTLIMLDSCTTVAPSSTYLTSQTSTVVNTGQVLTLINHNSKWYEVAKSNNPYQISGVQTQNITAASSLTVNNDTRVLTLKNIALNGSTAFIHSISGGYIGQIIMIENLSDTIIKLNTAGNITMNGTGIIAVIQNTAAATMMLGAAGKWNAFTY